MINEIAATVYLASYIKNMPLKKEKIKSFDTLMMEKYYIKENEEIKRDRPILENEKGNYVDTYA